MLWSSGRQGPAARLMVLLRRSYGAQGGWSTSGGEEKRRRRRDSPELKSRSIPAIAWSGVREKRSEGFRVLRRNSCGGYWGPWRGGAVSTRRGRGFSMAERVVAAC